MQSASLRKLQSLLQQLRSRIDENSPKSLYADLSPLIKQIEPLANKMGKESPMRFDGDYQTTPDGRTLPAGLILRLRGPYGERQTASVSWGTSDEAEADRDRLQAVKRDCLRFIDMWLQAVDSWINVPEDGKAGERESSERRDWNAAMYSALEKHYEAREWTVRQWADYLGCSVSTVHKQETWKKLAEYRESGKLARKMRQQP